MRSCGRSRALKSKCLTAKSATSIAGGVADFGITYGDSIPDSLERVDLRRESLHVLLPKDYIRYVMTGEYATDVGDASGTLPAGTWLERSRSRRRAS